MMADSQQTTGFICNIGLKGLTVILYTQITSI